MSIKGLQTLYNLILKDVIKGSGQASGILSIGSDVRKIAMNTYAKIMDSAKKQGVDLNTLGPEQLKMIVAMNKPKPPRVISGTSAEGKAITEKLFGKKGEVVDMTGKNIDTSQGIMGGKSVKELMESGQVQKGTDNIKIRFRT